MTYKNSFIGFGSAVTRETAYAIWKMCTKLSIPYYSEFADTSDESGKQNFVIGPMTDGDARAFNALDYITIWRLVK